MKKRNVCVLFGGMSPEHEVSLRSAESVLKNMDPEKYNVFPLGITKEGNWILFGGDDYSLLPSGMWQDCEGNKPAAISPVYGQGLLTFEGEGVVRQKIDVVFPVLHGENGEDGSIQGLLQLSGIPYVGSGVAASAVAMDKTLTKLIADQEQIPQAKWVLVRRSDLKNRMEETLDFIEQQFSYPVFVKPAGTGSSVGVAKAGDREKLKRALLSAGNYDSKILVEECIYGKEVEVAVMGNEAPVVSICGEIDAGAEFYDYDAKYVTNSSTTYIPARIPDQSAEMARDRAARLYQAMGCRGLSRVDFFVQEDGQVIFNEINSLPGFTSISMYPKLFVASGIPYPEIIDELIRLAEE